MRCRGCRDVEELGMTKVSLYLKIPLKSIDFNFKKTSEICENRRIRFYTFPQVLKTFDATKKYQYYYMSCTGEGRCCHN